MDISTIAAAQTSIKALVGLAKIATAATVDHELKARLIDIQAGILDAQAKLGDAQAERLDLLDLVAELRAKIRVHETASAALASYQLHEIDTGKYLYKFISDAINPVEHFACPTCHNGGKVTVLQSNKSGSQQIFYVCKTCQFSIYVGKSDPRPPIIARSVRHPGY